MKITAYLYYSFAVIFLLARIFQNIGGDLIFLAHIMGLFFLAWLILIVYGLFKYRKLPLLILFLIPFINYFIFPYTEKAIFYNIQLPHYQKAINDIERLNTDLNKEPVRTNIKIPFADWTEVSQIPKTNTFIIRFGVGSTGAVGTHWGYVYCSDGKTNVANIPEFAGRVAKINENWYFWNF